MQGSQVGFPVCRLREYVGRKKGCLRFLNCIALLSRLGRILLDLEVLSFSID